ncbi:MAG: aminomethyl-transferring glycine dehydrogenase subunit GcvPB, partial [Erysipelotrichaceae bacterium]|nr:aminomethyl-transferring glycine dehydrogenase subunit GcvPB [Erysipelotrichaceae bacterium]
VSILMIFSDQQQSGIFAMRTGCRFKGHRIHAGDLAQEFSGFMQYFHTAGKLLCEITGMDAMTFEPAAGAHGEYTGLLLIRKYHQDRNDTERVNIIVPDSAHGTNPASAAMAGFKVVNIPSNDKGGVDLDALRAAVGKDTAGLMLTNPNTLGLFDPNILEITRIVHEAGGLCYYDGANLNAIMGRVRPGDMGFDCVHLNLHKTFATPHGGGGPGSGPVGCKEFLKKFLPCHMVEERDGFYYFYDPEKSMGQVRSFYGNFLVVVKALTYILTLGKKGIPEASGKAVLNANYMMHQLKDHYHVAYDQICMHEFVLSLDDLKKETGVSAMDIAKGSLDFGIHPPTMYFPLIVHEALMFEPAETESRETIDEAVKIYLDLYEKAHSDPEYLHNAPHHCPIGRPDDVKAAREPVLKYEFND